jgi:hypothetical protein
MDMLLSAEGVTTYTALRQASAENLRTIVARWRGTAAVQPSDMANSGGVRDEGRLDGLTAYNKNH